MAQPKKTISVLLTGNEIIKKYNRVSNHYARTKQAQSSGDVIRILVNKEYEYLKSIGESGED